MMTKIALPVLALCLLAATAADAQYSGRHGGGGQGRGSPSGSSAPARPSPTPAPSNVAADKADIVGVVQSIDAANDRVTIAYQPVEALNWPAGTKPFEVAKSALLAGVTVGEKVRFRLESQQIYVLKAFTPDQVVATPVSSLGPSPLGAASPH
jgi:Cu/Ag efflux protein CusF